LLKYESEPMYPFVPENAPGKKTPRKTPMRNITINIPEIYDENIQKLIKLKLQPSRSEAVRTAIREFLHQEYENLESLGFFKTA